MDRITISKNQYCPNLLQPQQRKLVTNSNSQVFNSFYTQPIVNSSNDGKFSFKEAGKNFIKGATSFITEAIKHPVKSLAIIGGLGVAAILCPPIGSVMIATGAITGAFTLGAGALKAAKCAYNKDYDGVEKSFTSIGSGTSTLALSAIFARGVGSAKGIKYSKFKPTPKGISNWIKDSYVAIKQQGFRSGDIRASLDLAETNLQAGYQTLKSWHNNKITGTSIIKAFRNERWNALQKMHGKQTIITQDNQTIPTGIINKAKIYLSQDKTQAIKNINNKIQARQKLDIQDLKLSDDIIHSLWTPHEFIKQSWTFAQNKNN